MVVSVQYHDEKRFLIKRSELTTLKLFVEFYLPEYQAQLNQLKNGLYPLKSLGELCSRIFAGPFGSNRTVDMYQDSGIPYIRVKDVLPEGIAEEGLTYISEEKHKDIGSSRVAPGDVLMTIAGRLGTAAVFPEHLQEGNITGHIVGLEFPKAVNPHYIVTFINSHFGEFQVTRWGHRTTRPELNLGEIRQILVSLPPRDVQDRIAQVMQDAYATRRAKLAEAEALLGGIDGYVCNTLGIQVGVVEDEKRFLLRFSELEDRFDFKVYDRRYISVVDAIEKCKYQTADFGALCREMPYRGTQPKYIDDGEVLVLKTVNVGAGEIDFKNARRVSAEFLQSRAGKRAQPHKNDLLITSTGDGSWGRASVFNSDLNCIVDGHITIVRLKREHNSYFFQAFLNSSSGQAQFWQRYRGHTGQTEIYPNDIAALRVVVPPREVQDGIADEISSRRAAAKRQRAEAESVVAEAKAQVERMILGETER
jgi:restriction endonuclease S subunit